MTVVVEYTYDTWGKVVDIAGSTTLGESNPFRYRGYYWDSEIGMYYLNSRYYDPVTGRFINADGLLSTGQGVLGYNMYAYCLYNPINFSDPDGRCATCDAMRKRCQELKQIYDWSKAQSDCKKWEEECRKLSEQLKKCAATPPPPPPQPPNPFVKQPTPGSGGPQKGSGSANDILNGPPFPIYPYGINHSEIHWWGVRYYIDGPTCDLITKYGSVTSTHLWIHEIGPWEMTVTIEGVISMIDYFNNGRGVYYDIWWGTPESGLFTMRSQ